MIIQLGRFGLVALVLATVATNARAHGDNDHIHGPFGEVLDLGSAITAAVGLAATVAIGWYRHRRSARA